VRYIWPPTNVYAAANLLSLVAVVAAVAMLAVGRRKAAVVLGAAIVLLQTVPYLVALALVTFGVAGGD
jgi:uncharacterized membrane protein YkgB